MQFSKEQNLTFEQAVEKMFEKLGDSKIMALASAVGTHVMVRNVSCLFYNNKIYFKTDKNFRKTQQLFENPNVALCWSGVQVEGDGVFEPQPLAQQPGGRGHQCVGRDGGDDDQVDVLRR